MAQIVRDAETDPGNPIWRAKVRHLPPLDEAPLRPAQITAIKGIEKSLAGQQFDRSLVQMATGAGKAFTAVTKAYRLLKFGGARATGHGTRICTVGGSNGSGGEFIRVVGKQRDR